MNFVIGTSSADTITERFTSIGVVGSPGSGRDSITAGGGDDFISGGAGDDTIDGGDGIDTVAYSTAPAAVSVNLALGTARGGAGSDVLRFIENVIGSNFADSITGNKANNALSGRTGNDTFFGSTGNDTIDGGAGRDTANYSSLGQVVTLGALGSLKKGTAGTDTLIGIETIVGSTRIGDTVDLSGASAAPATGTVTNLTTGVVVVNGTAPLPLTFSVSQFENVIGSGFADSITGNKANNSLSGGLGNDTIDGGVGADTITGGGGADQLTGSLGKDVFVYTALTDSLLSNFDIITDYSVGDVLDRPGTGATLNSSVGIASGLTAANLTSFLNSFIFTANASRAFTAVGSTGTFIAFNDATAGFNASSDSILWLPTYSISATSKVRIV
jgi:serralysin